MAQVWLVTGSSRGLGRAIVEAGLAAGNKVLATARGIESLADLPERYGRGGFGILRGVVSRGGASSEITSTGTRPFPFPFP